MQITKIRTQAMQAFNKGDNKKAIQLYTQAILAGEAQDYWNRAFLYNFEREYEQSIKDCINALELGFKKQMVYILLIKNYLIKQELKQAEEIMKIAIKLFPQSKKLKQIEKDLLQKQEVDNQGGYIEKLFIKFCQHPKVSTYLKDQSYLTKLQILVRNPKMVDTLAKLDPRVQEAYDVILESEQPPK